MPKIVIIGAGAAGCFCAVNLKRGMPEAEVVVLESHSKALAKVAITGGGRCNLTNSFRDVRSIQSVYPRGDKLMKRLLKRFSHEDTMQWFENEGVRLVTQDDQCVFPQSQDAMEIVLTLTRLMKNLGVQLHLNSHVTKISHTDKTYLITTEGISKNSTPPWEGQGEAPTYEADAVVVTTGGMSKGVTPLWESMVEVIPPLPSLFTFNIKDEALHALMGTVVNGVTCRLTGTKLQSEGPLLITHWGMSGPAILKLSSYGARVLAERDYKAELSVNWFGEMKEPQVLELLRTIQSENPQKQLSSVYPDRLINRHWLYLINKIDLQPTKRWQEVGPKQMNRLASLLTNDAYRIDGRGAYKEEFVTCGGVALSNIDMNTLECKQHPGLYFAGEVLDVDAITGGFNLQAAWSMGWAGAVSLRSKLKG